MIVFILLMTGLALVLPPAVVWGGQALGLSEAPSLLYETTWLMAVLTTVIVVYIYRRAGDYFVLFYLSSLAIKLLAGAGYCIWMILEDGPGAPANIVHFLAVYLLFTGLEVAFLTRLTNRRNRA